MTKDMQKALDALFPDTGETVSNIKFFPGSGSVTPTDLVSEVLKADAQIRAGTTSREKTVDSELLS